MKPKAVVPRSSLHVLTVALLSQYYHSKCVGYVQCTQSTVHYTANQNTQNNKNQLMFDWVIWNKGLHFFGSQCTWSNEWHEWHSTTMQNISRNSPRGWIMEVIVNKSHLLFCIYMLALGTNNARFLTFFTTRLLSLNVMYCRIVMPLTLLPFPTPHITVQNSPLYHPSRFQLLANSFHHYLVKHPQQTIYHLHS